MELRIKDFNIFGVHRKIRSFFFEGWGDGGFTEKQYIGEGIAYKGWGWRPGQFADLREA